MYTFFLFILIFLGCSQSPINQVTKSPGHQVTRLPVHRIISLAPSITEQLYSLDVEQKIVGVTTFCTHPAEAKTKEKIGTYLEPNLEKIVALRPSVVLATESQKKETIKKLKDLGIKIFVFKEGKTFKEITEQFLQLAKIIDEEKGAKRIITSAEKKIKKIIARDKNFFSPKVFLQLGSEPLVTAGKDTFLNEMVGLVGGINVAANLDSGVNRSGSHQGYFRINREKVIREDPDVILIVSMGGTTEKELKAWLKFKNLKAVREKKIYILDADKICRPTVTCFLEGLETVSKLLR